MTEFKELSAPRFRSHINAIESAGGWPVFVITNHDIVRSYTMQWNDSANVGFSKVKPWLPVPPSYKTHNVAAEMKDENSILSFYRQLLALRHREPALLDGDYISINEDDPHVLAYLRRYKDEAILVVLNVSASAQDFRPGLSPLEYPSPKLSVLLTSLDKLVTETPGTLSMQPYSVFIAKVTK